MLSLIALSFFIILAVNISSESISITLIVSLVKSVFNRVDDPPPTLADDVEEEEKETVEDADAEEDDECVRIVSNSLNTSDAIENESSTISCVEEYLKGDSRASNVKLLLQVTR